MKNHLILTDRKGGKIILHQDELKEAFGSNDDSYTVCVLGIKRKDGSDAFLLVEETLNEIEKQLRVMGNVKAVLDEKLSTAG